MQSLESILSEQFFGSITGSRTPADDGLTEDKKVVLDLDLAI